MTLLTVLAVLAAVIGVGAVVLSSSGGDDPEPVAAPSPTGTEDDGHGDDGHGDDGHGATEGEADPRGEADQVEIPPQVPEDAPLVTEREVRAVPEPGSEPGVKRFTLTADEIRWEFLPEVSVTAWGYNAQVPGPEFWVDQGERVVIEFTNNLPVPTTIHWHGIAVPNEMDGVPFVSQDPIQPGETFTYDFIAEPSGTFWYHSHFDSIRQLDMGLVGAFIIKGADEPEYDKEFVQLIDEWIRLPDGRNGWEGATHAGHAFSQYGWFTLNGKSFPATEDMVIEEGERVRLRMINVGYQNHPMHLHGKRMTVVSKDGAPLPAPYQADTVLVGAGERYDVEIDTDDPGDWMFHCHILHHVANDGIEPGGLMTFLRYDGYQNSYQKSKESP